MCQNKTAAPSLQRILWSVSAGTHQTAPDHLLFYIADQKLCRRWDLVTSIFLLKNLATPPPLDSVRLSSPTSSLRSVSLYLKIPLVGIFKYKCRRWDLNPHTLLHSILSRTCLPFHHSGNSTKGTTFIFIVQLLVSITHHHLLARLMGYLSLTLMLLVSEYQMEYS